MSSYPSSYVKCIARRYLLRNILDGMSNTYSSPGLLNHKFHHMWSVCSAAAMAIKCIFHFFTLPVVDIYVVVVVVVGRYQRKTTGCMWTKCICVYLLHLSTFLGAFIVDSVLADCELGSILYMYRGSNAYIINNRRQMQESYDKEETVGIMWPLSGYYELVLIRLLE